MAKPMPAVRQPLALVLIALAACACSKSGLHDLKSRNAADDDARSDGGSSTATEPVSGRARDAGPGGESGASGSASDQAGESAAGSAGHAGAAVNAAGASGSAGIAGKPSGPGPRCDMPLGLCLEPDGQVCDAAGFCCTPTDFGRCCGDNGCQLLPPGLTAQPDPGAGTPPTTTDEPWVPPVPPGQVGDEGLHPGDAVLCPNQPGYVLSHSVWSDDRGVFALVATDGSFSPEGVDCKDCPIESIFQNPGTGWELLTDPAPDRTRFIGGQTALRGFVDGPLLLYGYGSTFTDGQACGLALFSDGTRSCEPVDGVSDVSVVSSELAYAVLQGSLERYDGKSWGPVEMTGVQEQLISVWAGDGVVMATGSEPGHVYSLENGSWKLQDTRTLDSFSAIFGLAKNDVLAGTAQGRLYHYDGSAWTEVAQPAASCPGRPSIMGMWGASGQVYFYSATSLSRWNGSSVEQVTSWGCDGDVFPRINSLWGNSPTDVFLAIVDERQPLHPCGSTFILRFDGTLFHRL